MLWRLACGACRAQPSNGEERKGAPTVCNTRLCRSRPASFGPRSGTPNLHSGRRKIEGPAGGFSSGGCRRMGAAGGLSAGISRPGLSTVAAWEAPLLLPMARQLPDSGQGALSFCLQLPPPR